MKKHLFFLVMFSGISVLAQLPQKLKYDQLSYSFDSATVLITAGKTMAVYDQVNAGYLIQPTKNRLINFPRSNQYAEIPLKGGSVCIHATYMYNSFSICGSDSLCNLGFMRPEMGSYIVSANGQAYDSKGEKYTGQKINPELEWGSCNISKYGDFYFITNSQGEYHTPGYPGERNYVPAFSESGVYSLAENKWAIEPIYQTLYKVMNCFFGLRQIVYDSGRKEFVYDIYQIKDSEMYQVKTDVQQVDEELLYKLLDADTIIETIEPGYHVFGKDSQGSGLVRFTLFADENYTVPDLSYQILLEPVADFVFYEPYFQKLGVVYRDSLLPLQIYHIDTLEKIIIPVAKDSVFVRYNFLKENQKIKESVLIADKHLDYTYDSLGNIYLTESRKRVDYMLSGFGFKVLNDSLINFQDHYLDYDLIAIHSILYPDEDSMDASQNVLYFPRQYLGKSGVYNLNSHEWFLFPVYDRIYSGSAGFLCKQDQWSFSCYDKYGKLLRADLSAEDIYKDSWYLNYIAPFEDATSIFDAPNGFWHHTQPLFLVEGFEYLADKQSARYYIKTKTGLGIYIPGEDFANLVPGKTYEFVHYNPSLNVLLFAEGDSLYMQSDFGNFVAPKKDGELIFMQHNVLQDPMPSYQFLIITGQDTTRFGELLPGYESLTTIRIKIDEDLLLLTDHTTKIQDNCEKCRDTRYWLVSRERHFESENSSVWKSTTNGWEKISPYYATITRLRNGRFIASSGHFYEKITAIGNWGQTLKDIPARYFLLDSNFHAIPFLDYFDFPHIEDLGFGIKIKLDNGYYFFVTYDGVAVTDAAWHHFEMERGKLKAILNTTYMYDEDGNQILDDMGYPVEATTETVKYFKLP